MGLLRARRAGALHPGDHHHRLHQRHRGADRAVAAEGPVRPADHKAAGRFLHADRRAASMPRPSTYALAIGLACLALVVVLPQVPHHAAGQHRLAACPTAAAAQRARHHRVLVLATLVATAVLHLPVGPSAASSAAFPQSLPDLQLPPFQAGPRQAARLSDMTLAMLGAIRSLLCARVADNLIDAPRHDPNQELMAQGVANFVGAGLRRHPGHRHHRAHRHQRALRRHQPGGGHGALGDAVWWWCWPPRRLAITRWPASCSSWPGTWASGASSRLRHFSLPYRTIMLGLLYSPWCSTTVAVEVGLMLACVFFIYRTARCSASSRPPRRRARACPPVWRSARCSARSSSARWASRGAAGWLPTRTLVLDLHRLISMDTSGLEALEQ